MCVIGYKISYAIKFLVHSTCPIDVLVQFSRAVSPTVSTNNLWDHSVYILYISRDFLYNETLKCLEEETNYIKTKEKSTNLKKTGILPQRSEC